MIVKEGDGNLLLRHVYMLRHTPNLNISLNIMFKNGLS